MSRSRKKTPIIKTKCNPHSQREIKRIASKAVRNRDDLSSGAVYKRVFDSWNICDHKNNMYKVYDQNGRPRNKWIRELDDKLRREYYAK